VWFVTSTELSAFNWTFVSAKQVGQICKIAENAAPKTSPIRNTPSTVFQKMLHFCTKLDSSKFLLKNLGMAYMQ